MLQQQSRGCGSRQEVPENPFTFQQGAGKPGLTEGTSLFRGPKIVSILSSLQSMCVFHGMVTKCGLAAVYEQESATFPLKTQGKIFLLFHVAYFFSS